MKTLKQLREKYGALIAELALRNGLDESLVAGVIWQESRGDPQAISVAGAKGLMQLMPATARRFKVKNVFDPEQNIAGGTKYLAWLMKRFNFIELALAGYNAGEGNVEKYKRQIPPFKETQKYVPAVLSHMQRYRALIEAEEAAAREAAKPAFEAVEVTTPKAGLKDVFLYYWQKAMKLKQ